MAGVRAVVAAVPDPRAADARHRPDSLPPVALAATPCGARTYVDLAPRRTRQAQTRSGARSQILDPTEARGLVRAHGSIETDRHRLLDGAVREDAILTRTAHPAQDLALLRRLALTILRRILPQDPTTASPHTGIHTAGWHDAVLDTPHPIQAIAPPARERGLTPPR